MAPHDPARDASTITLSHQCESCGHLNVLKIRPEDLPRVERFYSLRDCEKLLAISRRTLKQLIYDGKLKASKPLGNERGRPWRVRESDLIAFQEGRGKP